VSLPVRTTPEADAQIREVDSWWRKNRPASPNLFADELAASFDIIGNAPDIGRLYHSGFFRLPEGCFLAFFGASNCFAASSSA